VYIKIYHKKTRQHINNAHQVNNNNHAPMEGPQEGGRWIMVILRTSAFGSFGLTIVMDNGISL